MPLNSKAHFNCIKNSFTHITWNENKVLALKVHTHYVAPVERSGHVPVFVALEELTGLHLKTCNDDKAPMKPLATP